MCCFSRPIPFVGSTKIFARGSDDGRQLLIYALDVTLDDELAMILPLPVAHNSTEDAVSFINLEGEESFFGQLADAFPTFMLAQTRSFGPPVRKAPKLQIHDVGQYEASFVPEARDFARLDERFRLPDGFLAALPVYGDYGFAVFRLKPHKKGWFGGAKRQSVQPMAFTFPRREPRSLFFPTVHVHDGSVPARADFDHALYCQADGVLEAILGWQGSGSALGNYVTLPKSRELLDVARGGFTRPLLGSLKNADTWLREPVGVTLSDLKGSGISHRFEVRANAAHMPEWQEGERAPWAKTASQDLAKLCRGLRDGLRELETTRGVALRLAPLSDDLPAHFMNGMQLWQGESHMNGSATPTRGPGRIRFSPFSQLVETQSVTLGFAELPDQEGAVALHRELSRLLDRAVQ
jgi:hypothetical protein